MKSFSRRSGFTLLELLVAIAIIGIVASIVLNFIEISKDKAKITHAQSDMRQPKIAMQLYLNDHDELPPTGNNCSGCANPCDSTWTDVVDELVAGNYYASRIDTDPWGNYYCYDDNYRVNSCAYDSPLWSMGPNGVRDTTWYNGPPTIFSGDDFGTIVEAPQC